MNKSKYELPLPNPRKRGKVETVMLRLPYDLVYTFNKVLEEKNLSGQQLVESMVRHCLNEIDETHESLKQTKAE